MKTTLGIYFEETVRGPAFGDNSPTISACAACYLYTKPHHFDRSQKEGDHLDVKIGKDTLRLLVYNVDRNLKPGYEIVKTQVLWNQCFKQPCRKVTDFKKFLSLHGFSLTKRIKYSKQQIDDELYSKRINLPVWNIGRDHLPSPA